MTEIGAFEAKNRLSELLSRAEKGERIFITRRGKRVAMLVGLQEIGDAKGDGETLLERIRAFRERAGKGPESPKRRARPEVERTSWPRKAWNA